MNEKNKIFFDNIAPKYLDTAKARKIFIHDENHIISNERIKKIIKASKVKLFFIIFTVLAITFFASFKAFMYTIVDFPNSRVVKNQKENRGLIFDRNENIISASIPAKDLYLDPRKFLTPQKSKSKLQKIFPKKDFSKLETINNYRLIKKYISKFEEIEIRKIGEPGFVIEQTSRRVYPQNNLFSHITGFLSKHGEAQSKLEKSFDNYLSEGNNLKLTLDLKVQNIVHEEMTRGMRKFRSNSAASIIMNVNNGEILSLVSLPDYNPNHPGLIRPFTENNLITSARYEMGSTLKTFTVATAINAKVDINKTFFDITKPYYISKNQIKDVIKFNKPQNISNIFINSSNIGSIKVFDLIGLENQKKFFDSVGLNEMTTVDGLKSINNKFPNIWDNNSGRSLSFGYGASLTPISFVRSFSALVNGGYKIKPSIIKGEMTQKEKILDIVISKEINNLLFNVVESGTGQQAKVNKLRIGGKTGTARKIKNGIYSQDVITSFVGVFPAEKPKFLVFVLFDEPKSENNSYNFYGGNTAAPVFSKIVSRIYPILKLENTLTHNSLRDN